MSHVSLSRFAPHAAGPGLDPLTEEQLRQLAPSAFTGKHESRSERYTYIPTSAVIDGLRANGFELTFAKQGGSRVPGKTAFTKHLIRFRLAGQAPAASMILSTPVDAALLAGHRGVQRQVLRIQRE